MSNNPSYPPGSGGLPSHFQGLRVSAPPFIPNVNAVPFQPGSNTGGGGMYPTTHPMYGGGHYQMRGHHPEMYGQSSHMMYPQQHPVHHQSGYSNSSYQSVPQMMRREPLHVTNDVQYYNDGRYKTPSSTDTITGTTNTGTNSDKPLQSVVVGGEQNNVTPLLNDTKTTPPNDEIDSWEQIADDTQSDNTPPTQDSTPPTTSNEPVGTKGAVSSTNNTVPSIDRDTTSSNSNSPNIEQRVTKNTVGNKEDTSTTTAATKSVKTVIAPPKDLTEKENINIIFIGHVDAGKSTIGGHIMYLTGGVDKRTLDKYEREAKEKNRETWYLSWALDTNQEERDKGKTVEVGRAYFETDRKRFTILDAPGHAGFVPNMIGGAVQADIGVLVISARRGEFETGFEKGGQTREHAMLAKTAGVKHLVVLINKMDDPTVQWSVDRYEECKTKLTPFLKKLGFNPKTDLYFMPVSGLTGANLKEPLTDKWYKGPAFIPYLDNLPTIIREDEGPFRMPIADKFKDMGTVVMGKVESGSVCKGSQFIMMPNRTMVEVLSVIRVEEEVAAAYSGDNIKLKIKGLEEEDTSPGFVLCSPHDICHVGRVFDAQVVILEYKSIICAGFSCVIHVHCAVEEVEITQLIAKIDKKTGKRTPEHPKFIKQDNTAIARFQTSRVICMETFKVFPAMARFTLRDEGKTIAIGKILKIVE